MLLSIFDEDDAFRPPAPKSFEVITASPKSFEVITTSQSITEIPASSKTSIPFWMAKPAAAPLPVTQKPITTKIDLENSLFGNAITTTVGTTTKVPTTLPTTRSSTTTRSTTTTTWTPRITSTLATTSRKTTQTWTSTTTQLPGRLFSPSYILQKNVPKLSTAFSNWYWFI